MPKLKITESLLHSLAPRMKGAPIFLSPDGELLRPGVADLLTGGTEPGAWQPANEAAKSMFLCREACQDILLVARDFEKAPLRRVLKNLSVSLVTLLDHLVRLLNVTNVPGSVARAERLAWPSHDQRVLDDLAQAVRRHKNGPIRQVRNKLGAHLDDDVLSGTRPSVSAESVLPVLGECVALLLLLTNYRRVYVWIRTIPAPGVNLVETFFDYPAVVRWLADDEGNVLAAAMSHLALDPRHEFSETFHAVFRLYNALAQHADCGLPILTLSPMANQEAGDAAREGLLDVMMAYPIEIAVDV